MKAASPRPLPASAGHHEQVFAEDGVGKAKGGVKQGIGNVTGDEMTKAKGTADKAKGKVERAVGGVKVTLKGKS
jgi:uncharacterized protein YjbJ (UPF0337 family)